MSPVSSNGQDSHAQVAAPRGGGPRPDYRERASAARNAQGTSQGWFRSACRRRTNRGTPPKRERNRRLTRDRRSGGAQRSYRAILVTSWAPKDSSILSRPHLKPHGRRIRSSATRSSWKSSASMAGIPSEANRVFAAAAFLRLAARALQGDAGHQSRLASITAGRQSRQPFLCLVGSEKRASAERIRRVLRRAAMARFFCAISAIMTTTRFWRRNPSIAITCR